MASPHHLSLLLAHTPACKSEAQSQRVTSPYASESRTNTMMIRIRAIAITANDMFHVLRPVFYVLPDLLFRTSVVPLPLGGREEGKDRRLPTRDTASHRGTKIFAGGSLGEA